MNDKTEDPREGVKVEMEGNGRYDHLKHRQTYKRKAAKIQRNAPCSCGSGKKYKQCCEIRERISEQKAVIEIREKQNKK